MLVLHRHQNQACGGPEHIFKVDLTCSAYDIILERKKASELNTEYDYIFVGDYQRTIRFFGLVFMNFYYCLYELKIPRNIELLPMVLQI